jgi:hypothetical protein
LIHLMIPSQLSASPFQTFQVDLDHNFLFKRQAHRDHFTARHAEQDDFSLRMFKR